MTTCQFSPNAIWLEGLITPVNSQLLMLDEGGIIALVFSDLHKASSIVSYKMILLNLPTLNFSSLALTWIESSLTSTFVLSPTLDMYTGVPQESMLGPLLFFLRVSDLPSVNPDVESQFFADETIIYSMCI